ncbi:hypothetical protein ACGFY6_24290 [Streptomyces sp. NPDC048387]|uniref:hypothetical protein n=1 Tax=unclassified Streptomyces TaxID=2593676 RepID=UPI000EB21A77|nr:hypothetical protein [Streptomyces sp. 3211.6]RKT05407.1 hypothetical protein BX286_3403 [Streptomyces sp. 3211.6]
MASVIADHPPQELAAELAGLLRVDWRAVWPGVPDDEAGRAEWCAGFGWRPLWSQSGLWVRTAQGGRLHLAASPGPGRPVTRASYDVWKAAAGAASDGEAVLAVALERYAAHLAGVSAALGAPGWEGAWDRPDFPEPPAPGRWGDVRELRSPYRLAQWSYANPLAPVIVLALEHQEGGYAGGGTISLTFHGPADPKALDGPGWLL